MGSAGFGPAVVGFLWLVIFLKHFYFPQKSKFLVWSSLPLLETAASQVAPQHPECFDKYPVDMTNFTLILFVTWRLLLLEVQFREGFIKSQSI